MSENDSPRQHRRCSFEQGWTLSDCEGAVAAAPTESLERFFDARYAENSKGTMTEDPEVDPLPKVAEQPPPDDIVHASRELLLLLRQMISATSPPPLTTTAAVDDAPPIPIAAAVATSKTVQCGFCKVIGHNKAGHGKWSARVGSAVAEAAMQAASDRVQQEVQEQRAAFMRSLTHHES